MKRLLVGVLAALAVIVSGCGTPEMSGTGDAGESSNLNARAAGSRAYFVDSIGELSGRADAVVVGKLAGAAAEEPADEESESGLMARVTPFAVETWIKGDGKDTITLSELPLGLMEEEIADIDDGSTYVLFLERSSVRGQTRYNLVGGVGAYRVETSGTLARTEKAADTFPNEVANLTELTRKVEAAPVTWTGR